MNRAYNQAESTGESSYAAATTYQDKCTLTFTPGSNETWLLIATWLIKESSVSYYVKAKLTRTSGTPVDFNEQIYYPKNVADYVAGGCFAYETFGVSPPAQTYKIQYGTSNTLGTAYIKEAKIIAIRLESGDQKTANASPITYYATTNWQDGVGVTWTPGAGDYLILASADMYQGSASYQSKAQVLVDSTAYSSMILYPVNAANRHPWCVVKKVTLTNASHTIKIQYATNSTNSARYVGIKCQFLVILKLSDFPTNDYAEVEARTTYNASVNYQDKTTLSNTPVNGWPYVALASAGGDESSASYQEGMQLIQGATVLGESLHAPQNTAERHFPYVCSKYITGAGSSITWKIQYKTTNVSGTAAIQDARIIILRLTAPIDLLVDDVSHGQNVDSPNLTQKHNLASQDVSQAQSLDGDIILGAPATNLVVADSSHSQILDTFAVIQKFLVDPANISHSQILDAFAITQKHNLALADISQNQSLDGPFAVVQKFTVSISDLNHVHTLDDSLNLIQKVMLVVADISQSQTIDSVTLLEKYILAIQDISQAQSLDGIAITQKHNLILADLSQAQNLDGSLALSLKYILSVNDLSHEHNLDPLSVSQKHIIAVQDLSHNHVVDVLSLIQKHFLSVIDANHSHALDSNLTLTGKHFLLVSDLAQSQSLDSDIILVYAGALDIQNVGHSHNVESPTLAQKHVLSINDVSQPQLVDGNINLITILNLAVQNLMHSQIIDALALSQKQNLTVQDLAHSQVVDHIEFASTIDLNINDINHGHFVDSAIIQLIYSLLVQDLLHSHNLEETEARQVIRVVGDDVFHSHQVPNINIQQINRLVVQDLSHSQTPQTIYILDLGVDVELQEYAAEVAIQELSVEVATDEIAIAVAMEEEEVAVEIKGGT